MTSRRQLLTQAPACLAAGWLARAVASVENEAATWPDWKRSAVDHEPCIGIPRPIPVVKWTEACVEFEALGTDGITRQIMAPCVVPFGPRVGEFIIPRDYVTGGFVRGVNS